MAKQETPKDINIFLSDYFKAVAVDDVETRNRLLEDGKDMKASFTDLSYAFHTFVSTINPQIDLLTEINNTKFDILINVLQDSKVLNEETEEKLKSLLGNLEEVVKEIGTTDEETNLLTEVYKKETNKGDNK